MNAWLDDPMDPSGLLQRAKTGSLLIQQASGSLDTTSHTPFAWQELAP